MYRRLFAFILVAISVSRIYAQINPSYAPKLFQEDTIARIDIIIDPNNLQNLLNDITSDYEYSATCVYNNFSGIHDTIHDIGFRVRGNVSRLDEKKSFKISLNSFNPGRKYLGFEKINLKATGDDSFVRPKLCWLLCREMGIPFSWVSHAQLYINNELWGLYANVEHIDEEYVEKRFGNNDGNLYKCRYPSNLEWISNNQEDYKYTELYFGDRVKRVYELKTNTEEDDYTDLMELTNIISNSPDTAFKYQISKEMNIHSLLKFFAIELYLGHWDSYSTWGNNYFLYRNTQTDKFEFITYDMDLTLGISFSEDPTIIDMYTFDPIHQQPLRERVMRVPEFRAYYTYYMKQLIERFPPDTVRKRAELIQDFVAPSVEIDPYYYLPMEDFYSSLDEGIDMATYGVIEYLNLRYNTILEQIDTVNTPPIIFDPAFTDYSVEDTVVINFQVADDDSLSSVTFSYTFNSNSSTVTPTLTSYDSVFNLWNYMVTILPFGTAGELTFNVEVSDTMGNNSLNPIRGDFSLQVFKSRPNLRINEILTSNDECMTDEFGEHEDWIEIFNADTVPVDLSSIYLSDSYENPTDWRLPDLIIQPGEYMWFWADNETEQGDMHADFRLSRNGETVYLFEKRNNYLSLLDSMAYPEQERDVSFGYEAPDASQPERLLQITPGKANNIQGLAYLTFEADMSVVCERNAFNINYDEVDVVANFNNWNGSTSFTDTNEDSVYVHTEYDLSEGDEIYYRYRVNKDNEQVEFANIPGDNGHRSIILNEGCNLVSHLFSDFISTSTLKPELKLSIFPNPAEKQLVIMLDDNFKFVELYDVQGNLVHFEKVKGSFVEIPILHLSNGVYFIRVVSLEAMEYTSKVIVKK